MSPHIALLSLLVTRVTCQVSVGWSYQAGSTAVDRFYGMAVDPTSKAVVMGGLTEGAFEGRTRVGYRDWLAVKLDTDGAVQWTYLAGEATSYSQINDVAIDGSGNVALVGVHQGSLFGTGYGQDDMAIVMLNSAGVLQWSYQQGSTGKDSATCVAFDSSSNVIVGGWTRGTISGETAQGGMDDMVLLKLNSAGAQQWLMQTALGTSARDFIQDLTVDASDNIFVTGVVEASFDSNTYYGAFDAFILKTDSAGTFVWSYQMGTTATDYLNGIVLSGGDIIAAGYTYGSFPTYTNGGAAADAWIVKLNSAGVQQWLIQLTEAANSNELMRAVAVHPSSGNFAIIGDTTGDFNGDTNAGGNDFWVAEYDTTGTLQWSYLYGTSSAGDVFAGGAYDSDGDLICAGEAAGQIYSQTHVGLTDGIAVKLVPPSSTSTSKSTTSTITSSSTATTSSTLTSSTTGTSSTTASSTSTSTSSSSTTTSSSTSTSSSSSTSSTSTSSSSTSSTTSTTSSSSSTSSTSSSSTSSSSTMSSTTSSSVTVSSTSSVTSSTTVSYTVTATGTTSTSVSQTVSSTLGLDSSNDLSNGSFPALLYVSANEARNLEEERRQRATAAVNRLKAVENEVVSAWNVSVNDAAANGVATVVGPMQLLWAVWVVDGVVPGSFQLPGARVVLSAATIQEILNENNLAREDLIFSLLAVRDASNLQRDAVVESAAVMSSKAISMNFWRSDGSPIDVKDLQNPVQFTLEVTDADAKCAFWKEDIAKWSTDGVTTLSSSNTTIECSTSHLTIFAGIKDIFLTNIVLALKCSTIGSLLSGPAFARLQHTAWLSSVPSILNILFHVVGAVCILLAWLYDRKQERTIPWEEREVVLLRVKEEDAAEEEEDDDDGDAPPPSRWTRCMDCFNHSMEYVSHATGGDATIEALKEMAGNADTAAVNRAISSIQSHKSGVARAQIAILNQEHTKKALERLGTAKLRRSITTASEFLTETEDHGQSAAESFLQRGLLCRVATLWPASHPWLKALHFSMLAPVRASVALLFLKVISAGALSAVFFSSSSPTPDSDPECAPPKGLAGMVQSLTVGLVTTLLSDFIVSILFTLQVKRVVFSATEWTEAKKSRQHFRWNMWTVAFWLSLLLYGGFCNLYICLFLANVRDLDRASWLQSMAMSLLESAVLKSFMTAFILATIASLVLCCRPHVSQKIQAKWIKSDEVEVMDAAETRLEVGEKAEAVTPRQDDFVAVLPGAVDEA